MYRGHFDFIVRSETWASPESCTYSNPGTYIHIYRLSLPPDNGGIFCGDTKISASRTKDVLRHLSVNSNQGYRNAYQLSAKIGSYLFHAVNLLYLEWASVFTIPTSHTITGIKFKIFMLAAGRVAAFPRFPMGFYALCSNSSAVFSNSSRIGKC